MTQPFGYIRKLHGIPLEKVAKYAGISVALLHEFEVSKKIASDELKEKINDALKLAIVETMNADELFLNNKEELISA